MKLFPASAAEQLEFDKVKALLAAYCETEYATEKASALRIHTRRDFIMKYLGQAQEYKLLLSSGQHFPNDYVLNLSRELKLLSIPGAVLSGEQFLQIRKLAESMRQIFRWFDAERTAANPELAAVVEHSYYEKSITEDIDAVLDEQGNVKDNASDALASIRSGLYRKRLELRRVFERIIQKWSKAGYVADTSEAFLSGRRVVAVNAEYKRQVKGILLGESDTRKTAYLEPEETIELNNDVFALENEESKEVYRILRELTNRLSVHAALLKDYHSILGEYDFIRARARLAVEMNGEFPQVNERSVVRLIQAYHPLLLLYNRKAQKPTIPTNIELDDTRRILLVSGPNAGGKTVTLKTAGLLQIMLQSGLLIPVHPDSELGVFKQLMIHIGDTQSLEYDLSTYSSHLQHMKYFIEHANGRTLFFIDELGSGSDPNLGGAFAEVILEEMVKRHALGIVTTHYLNLKVMAGKTPGIINGAMAFDEANLMPLYKLTVGKPGSSYTFSIAERIGLDKKLIARARTMVDNNHFRLDQLLSRTEQGLQQLEQKEKELQKLMRENEALKKHMEETLDREKHLRQVELLKLQNKITEDRMTWLREMERKLKQIISDWKRAEADEDKSKLMKQLQALLFKQNQKQAVEKMKKKIHVRYRETGDTIKVGSKVLMRKNHQVGEVKEIRGRNAILQVGLMPITVAIDDLVVVQVKAEDENSRTGRE